MQVLVPYHKIPGVDISPANVPSSISFERFMFFVVDILLIFQFNARRPSSRHTFIVVPMSTINKDDLASEVPMNSWTMVPIPLHGKGIQACPVHVNAIFKTRTRFRYPQSGGAPFEETGAYGIFRRAFEGFILENDQFEVGTQFGLYRFVFQISGVLVFE
ncbi:uncharacterized protein PgNI_04838 [Pyricularia grisea]|uniref:Uncharacterized protein n=1 Tax=Pyricularia grisea TaxID=148305 RepID=A0A6P8B9N3_PYRGI|nr:uncharacterized protein PgNI_04838 [Pyricularia grisea]TLD12553.1 hypothetical protein PgNI_04838 [Pyricularia grisea]